MKESGENLKLIHVNVILSIAKFKSLSLIFVNVIHSIGSIKRNHWLEQKDSSDQIV